MKRTMVSMLILAVLSFWVPNANAEVSQDLDPMASPEPQAIVKEENSMNTDNINTSQKGDTAVTPEAAMTDKKVEETKKEKTKKSSKKKSSKKKSSSKKSSSKNSKKQKGSSY
ncbi:MAG: hypothetical protein WC530_07670 [Candidatus Omnitrophota bacterium]